MEAKSTSIAISKELSQKLELAAKSSNLSKGEYVASLFQYIEKHGINPKLHERPSTEIENLRKRFDQIISFQKTWEKEKLTPAVAHLLKSHEGVSTRHEKLTTYVQKSSEANQAEKKRLLENQTEAIQKLDDKIMKLSTSVSFVENKITEIHKMLSLIVSRAKENKGINIRI